MQFAKEPTTVRRAAVARLFHERLRPSEVSRDAFAFDIELAQTRAPLGLSAFTTDAKCGRRAVVFIFAPDHARRADLDTRVEACVPALLGGGSDHLFAAQLVLFLSKRRSTRQQQE
jgi:hypothetical protein